jgi:hypothetical protein
VFITFSFLTSLNAFGGDYFKKDKLVIDFHSPNWLYTPYGISTDYKDSFGFSFTFGNEIQLEKKFVFLLLWIGV